MIVAVTGIARSGSMWTYNVTRALLSQSKLEVLPREVPSDENAALRQAFLSPLADGQIYCIKVHRRLNSGLKNLKIVFTYRDVRESMFSYMRFMRCDFDHALKVVHGMMATSDYYFENFGEQIIRIKYDRIIAEPLVVALEIAQFLNLDVEADHIREICGRFSKSSVSNLMDSLQAVVVDETGTIADPEQQRRYEALLNLDGRTYRVLDRVTGFQSGHVANDRESWRTNLSEEQRRKLMSVSNDWLLRYGFEP